MGLSSVTLPPLPSGHVQRRRARQHIAATSLRPADPADLRQALAFALRYDKRRRLHTGDEMMARITAERLVEHPERSGFVVMKRPPREAGADAHYGPPRAMKGGFLTCRPPRHFCRRDSAAG